MTTARPGRGTSLTTQLVASVVALFVVVTIVTGTATVLLMRHQLIAQIDDQVATQVTSP